jgi:hypothetical protein
MFEIVDEDEVSHEHRSDTMGTALATTSAAPIDDMLADLNLDDLDGGDNDAAIIEALSGDDESVIEHVEAIEGAYAEQLTTTTDVVAPEVAAEAVAPTKPARKARAKKADAAPKEPKAPRDLSSVAPEFFVLADGVTDLDANKASVIASPPKQKKIVEKFENVFRSVSAGKAPSEFTKLCFNALKGGSTTSTDLVAVLKANEYSEGTARSQAGQLMALFPLLGVAVRDGQKLTFNANAPMSKRLATVC